MRSALSFRLNAQSYFGRFLLILLIWPASPESGFTASEQENARGNEVTQEDKDQELLEYIMSDDYRPIRSILIDQEAPLLGVHWGSTVLFDAPLKSEPEDASATLRLAKLAYRKSFNDRWTIKVMANYNNAGNLELGNNFAMYTGWKTSTITLGVFDPAFSLEKVSSRTSTTFMERALPVEALSERRSGGVGVLRRTSNAILNAGLFLLSPDYQGQSQSGQALVLHYVHSPLQRKQGSKWLNTREIWAGFFTLVPGQHQRPRHPVQVPPGSRRD